MRTADLTRPVSGHQPGSDVTISAVPQGPVERRRCGSPAENRAADERTLIELRRKVQAGELLSASTERLLWKMKFNGHLTVLVQNGRVAKSGYQEGYFRRRNDLGGFLVDV